MSADVRAAMMAALDVTLDDLRPRIAELVREGHALGSLIVVVFVHAHSGISSRVQPRRDVVRELRRERMPRQWQRWAREPSGGALVAIVALEAPDGSEVTAGRVRVWPPGTIVRGGAA
jgi:hypothetical protein